MKCSVVYPGQFTIWIVTLIKDYEDAILGALVKRGYNVCAAAGAQLTIEGEASSIIAIQLSSTNEDTQSSEISKVVKEVLDEKKFLYHSIIVAVTAGSSWYGSNIVLPKTTTAEAPQPPPLPEPDKSNLN